MEKDTTKLWHLVKCLNGENRFHGSLVIEDKGNSHTGTQAANVLTNFFSEEKDIKLTWAKTAGVRKLWIQQSSPDIMINFQKSELNIAIQNLNKKKSPGPDGLTNEMIQHLVFEVYIKVNSYDLRIFNMRINLWKFNPYTKVRTP